ncbi:phage-related protein tail component-like protein [uncultured Mediterranean phage uvMED]|nr:phage-related protein tail component-like protein [uncultured Mediterranean phage uvMED]
MALNSTSTVRLIDLLCEGPIEGFDDINQQIFLDETPLFTGNDANFPTEDVDVDYRLGGRRQTRLLQAGNATTTITGVAVEVGQNYSETVNASDEVTARDYGSGTAIRQINDSEIESVQLLFTIPRLFSSAVEGLAKGQPFNGSLQIRVFVQAQGSAYQLKFDKTITGVALTDYQIKTPVIELPRDAKGEGYPWNIKVEKVNLGEGHFEVKFANFEEVPQNKPLANGRANQLIWSSIIERQEIRSAYPYTACVGLELNTRQFGNLPNRAYLVKGRLVQIPHNAAVRNDGSLDLTQGVTFNGSTRLSWTTCPVCIFADMVLNDRYGCGDFVDTSNISYTDLYPLIQYANQLVTNQDGSSEARFACNILIGDRAAAYNVLQDLASVFRGMSYWSSNTVQLSADHGNLDGSVVDPVHLYTNSNVIGGAFNYTGSSLKTRSTSIRVRYNDPDNFYKPNFVVVEDAALITKYGYQTREVVAFGCTSRNQAYRLGRWMMASEELDGETVTFSTGLQGAIVFPGQVFAVADEMRQGARIAGRCSAATTTTLTADITVTLPAGAGHTLTATMPDGTIETKTISSVVGAVITVSSAFSAAPLAQSVWSIQSSTVVHQKFRCISVADGGDGTFAIVGVQHNDSIYNTADNADALEYQSVTTFDKIPTAPSGLTFETKEVRRNNNVVNDVFLGFTRDNDGNISGYEIRFKVGNGNYQTVRQTTNELKVEGVKPGSTVTFQIRSLGRDGTFKNSAWVSGSFVVPNQDITTKTAAALVELPPDPQNVQLETHRSNQVMVTWSVPKEGLGATSDRLNAEIRHSSKTDGSGTWPNSSKLTVVKANTFYAILPELSGEYLVRFIDDQNKKSSAVRSVIHTLTDAQPRLLILEDREDSDSPEFQGQKNDTFYSEEYDALVIDGNQTIDDILDIDALNSFDFLGTRKSEGEYFFANTLDLGAQFDIEFSRHLVMRGTYPADDIDERTVNIDTWTDFDGLEADDVNAEVYLRASTSGITAESELTENGDKLLLEDANDQQLESNLVFGDWIPLRNGHFQGRLFQFKCELSSDHIDQTPLLDELGFTAKMPLRTETSSVVASGTASGGKAVTFTNAFFQDGVFYNTPPSIGITAFNLASGDYYEVTSISRTGFTVKFKNSSNAVIDRNFQFQAVGYGSERS